jgi:hypothetical protein
MNTSLRNPLTWLTVIVLTATALLLSACEGMKPPVGQVGLQAGPGGTNLVGQLVWSPTTNIDLTVSGSFDPMSQQWGGNLLITFKEIPDEATRIQLRNVRAIHITNETNSVAFVVTPASRALDGPQLQSLFASAAATPGGYTLQRIK